MGAKESKRAKSARSGGQHTEKKSGCSSNPEKTSTRRHAEETPQVLQADIERLVQEHAAELTRVNEQLGREIENYKQTEARLSASKLREQEK